MADEKPFVFLGLDLSLSGTGCAAIVNGEHRLKTIKTKPEKFDDDLARLIHIRDEVLGFVESLGRPDMICVEDVFVPPRLASSNSALKLSMLGGIVRVMLYEHRWPFCLITPMQLKKFILNKGQGEKSLVLREVFRRWKVDAGDDNQADAVGLAHLARSVYAQNKFNLHHVFTDISLEAEPDLSKAQTETVVKVLKERPCYNF